PHPHQRTSCTSPGSACLTAAVLVSTGAADAVNAPVIAGAAATTTAIARVFPERMFIAILLLSGQPRKRAIEVCATDLPIDPDQLLPPHRHAAAPPATPSAAAHRCSR